MGYAPFLRKEVPSPFRAVDPDPPVGGQDDTVIIFIGKVLHFLSWSWPVQDDTAWCQSYTGHAEERGEEGFQTFLEQ